MSAEHTQVSGWVGPAGECGGAGVECACGVVFDGFDTLAGAAEQLEQHINDPDGTAEVDTADRAELDQDRIPTAEDFKRAEYIAGLRMLADALETNPHLRLPFDGNVSDIDVMPHGDQRQELADWARVLPGRKDKGEAAGKYLTLKGAFRGLKVKVICDREEVCERIVTGTREVTETVPDPALVAAVPIVKVTTTVEDVVWRCRPLLADADPTAGVR